MYSSMNNKYIHDFVDIRFPNRPVNALFQHISLLLTSLTTEQIQNISHEVLKTKFQSTQISATLDQARLTMVNNG